MRFFILWDFNWNIVVVFDCNNKLNDFLLFSGIFLICIGFLFFDSICVLIIFNVYLMIVSVCNFKKLNLIKFVYFILFLLKWVIGCIFFEL